MKVVLISDSHGRHDNIYVLRPEDALNKQDTLNNITGGVYLPEKADMIIHSGDMSMSGTEFEIDKFLKWYSSLPYKYKILIAGNHDFLFERQRMIAKEVLKRYPSIIYLESSEVVIEGIKIYGEPRQPWFHDWAFNVERGKDIKKYWDAIPDDVNILVTHGPPKGILDMTLRGKQVGCEDLLYRIWELKELKLCQFGHIHEDAGYEFINEIHFVNASVLNIRYQLQNKPLMFEIDKNKNITKIDMENVTEKKISPLKSETTLDELFKADIRICEILSVEKIEKKDRLYKLEVNTGLDTRVIVSGIAQQFSPEQLVGKKIPFVLNIPSALIGGVESHGMIIMAKGSDGKIYEFGDQSAEVGAQL